VIGTLVTGLGYGPTPVAEGIPRLEALLLETHGDRVLEALIQRFLGQLYAMAARFDEALDLVARSSIVLDELNQLTISWLHRRTAAYARQLAGDQAGAEREIMARFASIRESGFDGIDRRAIDCALDLASLYCDEGRWTDAEETLVYGRHVELATYRVEAFTRLAIEARIAAHHGLDVALPPAERAVELAERFEWLNFKARVWEALAEVRLARGETAEARAAVGTALGLYERKGNVAAAASLRAVYEGP
jgi:tetratricopeptide (TPR) repeat protein